MPSELATTTQGKQVTLADLMEMDIAGRGLNYAAGVFANTMQALIPKKYHAVAGKVTSAYLACVAQRAVQDREEQWRAWAKSQVEGLYRAVYTERQATAREKALVEKLASAVEQSSPGKVMDKLTQLIPDVHVDLPPINVNTNAASAEKRWTVEADDGIAVDVDEEAGVIRVRHE